MHLRTREDTIDERHEPHGAREIDLQTGSV